VGVLFFALPPFGAHRHFFNFLGGFWPMADKSDPQLAHMVYFTLKDRSPAAADRLIAACHQYLNDHPGTVYFSVGKLADLSRPVNDRDFDVALHVVFQNRKAHDDYQVAPRHNQFLAEQKDHWAKVRVFDSNLS
jgi:Stress responsive A/B Barrel Domain